MFNKLRIKLITAVSLAVVVIISVFAIINIRSQRAQLLEEVERHINQLGESVKRSTKYDMLLNNRAHLANIIQQIGNEQDIRGMRILNKEGTIIYSADVTEVGQMVDKKAQACYICHAENQAIERLPISNRTRIFKVHPDSTRLFGIIVPIYNETSCWQAPCHAHTRDQTVLGVLDVTIDIENIDGQIQAAKFEMGLMALIAILALSGIIWYFVEKWVNRPVNALVGATKQVASGDLDYTIGDLGEDELGLLARSFDDMTEKLSEARMQLFQSEKMASLGRLAAGVAHEINNPLTGILTYSSFLLKRAKDDEELQEDLNVIVRETKRSREIVRGLLDFARQSVPKKNRENINVIIERAISVVENQLAISHIEIVKRLGPGLPEVTVDANQVQQVIINLISNAADAIGGDGGTITISTSAIDISGEGRFEGRPREDRERRHWAGMEEEGVEAFVETTIADDGCGISKEDLEKIFEPFFTTKGQKGTGLGLAVTWGIIDNHSGSIEVESGIGEGTRVTIRLPASETAA